MKLHVYVHNQPVATLESTDGFRHVTPGCAALAAYGTALSVEVADTLPCG